MRNLRRKPAAQRAVPRYLECLLAYAPRETRTPTAHTGHKALNLARLPIPPQARDAADYRSGPALAGLQLTAVRPPG